MRRNKTKRIIGLIFILICLNILLFSVGKLVAWHLDNQKAIKANIKATETVKSINQNVSLPKLKKINNNTVGWIKVKGTDINYPVVQAKDNKYYLTHDYNKAYNSTGWIFMDYRNNKKLTDKNTIIYGHGRMSKLMFSTLKNILNTKWCKNQDNYYVKYYTNDTKYMWEVFSVYTIKTTSDYLQIDFRNNKEYTTFLNMLKKRSDYNFNVYLSETDKIITLSTCYDKTKKVVLHAKLISAIEN